MNHIGTSTISKATKNISRSSAVKVASAPPSTARKQATSAVTWPGVRPDPDAVRGDQHPEQRGEQHQRQR